MGCNLKKLNDARKAKNYKELDISVIKRIPFESEPCHNMSEKSILVESKLIISQNVNIYLFIGSFSFIELNHEEISFNLTCTLKIFLCVFVF